MPNLFMVNQSQKVLLIRFMPGEKLLASLAKVVVSENIESAMYTAIGSIRNPELAFYDPNTKTMKHTYFEGHYEVASLVGNLSYIYAEQTPVLHTHVVLFRDDHKPIAGHLIEAEVATTIEMFLLPIASRVERKFDENFNLFLWDI